jgi:hypothetical protein
MLHATMIGYGWLKRTVARNQIQAWPMRLAARIAWLRELTSSLRSVDLTWVVTLRGKGNIADTSLGSCRRCPCECSSRCLLVANTRIRLLLPFPRRAGRRRAGRSTDHLVKRCGIDLLGRRRTLGRGVGHCGSLRSVVWNADGQMAAASRSGRVENKTAPSDHAEVNCYLKPGGCHVACYHDWVWLAEADTDQAWPVLLAARMASLRELTSSLR